MHRFEHTQRRSWVLRAGALALLGSLWLAGCGKPAPITTEPHITQDPARVAAKVQADFDMLRPHVLTYVERYDALPEHLPDLRDTPDEQPLITTIPLDPWRVPYVLRRLDEDVVILTAGPDLIIGSDDDQVLRISFAGVETPAPAPSSTPDT